MQHGIIMYIISIANSHLYTYMLHDSHILYHNAFEFILSFLGCCVYCSIVYVYMLSQIYAVFLY